MAKVVKIQLSEVFPHLHKFYTSVGRLDNIKVKLANENLLTWHRNALEMVDDKSSDGNILVASGECELPLLVGIVYL